MYVLIPNYKYIIAVFEMKNRILLNPKNTSHKNHYKENFD